jgi:hypothetical protein
MQKYPELTGRRIAALMLFVYRTVFDATAVPNSGEGNERGYLYDCNGRVQLLKRSSETERYDSELFSQGVDA